MSDTRPPLLPLLLLAACAGCASAAVVIQNGAPCLEGRTATSSADIQKDDWACFVFCDGPHGSGSGSGSGSGRRSGVCRRCCLDPGQAVDTMTPASGGSPASTGESGAGSGETTKEKTTGGDEASTAATEASTA